MGLFDKAKLEKLTLRAFKPTGKADEPRQVSDAPADSYTVQVNPSSYSLARLANYSYDRGLGFSTNEAKWAHNAPVHLEFFRDRSTLIWNLALPIMLIFGFDSSIGISSFGCGLEHFFVDAVIRGEPIRQAFALGLCLNLSLGIDSRQAPVIDILLDRGRVGNIREA